jgi:epoxyqueuosine reductase
MRAIEERIAAVMSTRPCCVLATARIDQLEEREKSFFAGFMPQAVTTLVLGHHVMTEKEWKWYASDDGGEWCGADNHLRETCLRVGKEFERQGSETGIVAYPRESGLQFRYVAQAAGIGTIGTNAFLFHPEWGPWIHLRVMATTASLDIRPSPAGDQLCDECLLCVSQCPAGAIGERHFEGLRCRSFRKGKGEYIPFGPERELQYCKICAKVCPKGEKPLPDTGNT